MKKAIAYIRFSSDDLPFSLFSHSMHSALANSFIGE
jgi:hypothetical protein